MLTYGSIELLSKMLNFVIHGIVKAGAIVIGGAYASFSSLFDKLAYIMSENINIEGESSHYIKRLVIRLCQALGIKQHRNESFSHSFIRFVLTTYWHRTAAVVNKAFQDEL